MDTGPSRMYTGVTTALARLSHSSEMRDTASIILGVTVASFALSYGHSKPAMKTFPLILLACGYGGYLVGKYFEKKDVDRSSAEALWTWVGVVGWLWLLPLVALYVILDHKNALSILVHARHQLLILAQECAVNGAYVVYSMVANFADAFIKLANKNVLGCCKGLGAVAGDTFFYLGFITCACLLVCASIAVSPLMVHINSKISIDAITSKVKKVVPKFNLDALLKEQSSGIEKTLKGVPFLALDKLTELETVVYAKMHDRFMPGGKEPAIAFTPVTVNEFVKNHEDYIGKAVEVIGDPWVLHTAASASIATLILVYMIAVVSALIVRGVFTIIDDQGYMNRLKKETKRDIAAALVASTMALLVPFNVYVVMKLFQEDGIEP